MFVIRQEQLEVFSAALLATFIKAAGKQLREAFPRQTGAWNDDQLAGLIKKGVDRSAGYNISERKDVLQYLRYMIIYGEDFDTSENWAMKILRVRNLSGKEKTVRLMTKTATIK